ncbi:LysR family transcriptional regulator [Acidisoma cellulosilytica]|uniref:LysR family transcriptional regulator n=1 Tax=Acidisoma cellulosilyticum TaxID=2802395 RepID=A0A963YXN0_9PROT|nr:LysR substrate-binding domain-containing protein [Acidisoma cellulosilyticum]MCB8878830.1 LysR family transcriptional regulator [Acidisoma cellulosilyticum]
MPRSLPPLNALRAFEASARLGSFKAAADELGVTHGAISQHIRLLEDWLRAPLFERHHRRVLLTAAAQAYLSEVGPALDAIALATRRYGSGEGTVLRVNAPATFALRWLVPKLVNFQAQYPGVKVRLETSNEPLEALSGGYDVIIRGGPDSFYGFSARPFLVEERLPVCSPTLLKRLPLHEISDLRTHTLLHTLSLPRLWDDWLSKAGAGDLKPEAVLVLDHFYLTIQAALDGLGVAMGPTALVSEDLVQGRLVAPFSGPRLPSRSYCTYRPEVTDKGGLAASFCSWLEQEGNIRKPLERPRSAASRRPLQNKA